LLGIAQNFMTPKEEFYRLPSYTDDVDLNEKPREWESFYNYHRPRGAHGGKTPYEALKEKVGLAAQDSAAPPG
jgi:hypothetical protein